MEQSFLPGVIKLARYYQSLGDKTFNQLSDDELTWEPGIDTNSIMIIVKHLWGNMLSRWTNFLTEDGEKPWRDREGEFETRIPNRSEMLSKWKEGWNCFIGALEQLHEKDLTLTVHIRNEGHSVEDAIQRQLAHYAYHIGQIVFIGKIAKGPSWKSLSIPKGKSLSFNRDKFSTGKTDRHFADDK